MKLNLLKLKVTNSKGIEDDELLKIVKTHILSSPKLYNPKYTEKSDIYYFVGAAEKQDFRYFSTIKKETSLSTRNVDNKTAAISNKRAETEDLARFGFDFRYNLVAFVLKGHFGIKQFKESLLSILYEALDEISGYEIHLEDVTSQPVQFKLDTLGETISKLSIRNISLNISKEISDDKDSSKEENTEMEIITLMTYADKGLKNIKVITNKIKECAELKIPLNLKLTDTTGHTMTFNPVPKYGLSFDIVDKNDNMVSFIDIFTDEIERYMYLYL
ncbi:hypothetical protein [Cetobacterium ceti]